MALYCKLKDLLNSMKKSVTNELYRIANSLLGEEGATNRFKKIPILLREIAEQKFNPEILPLKFNIAEIIQSYKQLTSTEERKEFKANLRKILKRKKDGLRQVFQVNDSDYDAEMISMLKNTE